MMKNANSNWWSKRRAGYGDRRSPVARACHNILKSGAPLLVLSLFLATPLQAELESAGTELSAMNPPGDPERGASLGQTCLLCHAKDGPSAADSPVPPPHLRHQRASSLFYALADYRNGRRQSDIMMPFAMELSDQDMRDLSTYLAGPMLSHPPQPQFAGTPLHAESTSLCGLCHGETGMGEMQGIPVLAGQDQAYLEHALAAYRDGSRSDPTMQAVARALPPEKDEDLARYYAAQQALELVP